MLTIKNLHASVEAVDIPVLKGLDLSIKKGEVHAIMGPNGAGKSSLANVLSGKPGYKVDKGSVKLGRANLLEMEPEERAAAGLFLAFQYPVEIPGVTGTTFLRTAYNALAKARGKEELDALQLVKLLRAKAQELGMSDEMLSRPVNVGFSGGEKKRNEALQMAVLEPKLAILDETDSGLDIDALRIVAEGVNRLRDGERGFLVITHYQRLLDYIEPDYVHILADGKIVRSGDKSLATALEEQGYDQLIKEAA